MKLKTRKAVSKKVKVTKKKKLLRRHSGQNHLNAKETGAFKRKKRRSQTFAKKDEKNMKRAIPYAK